MNVSERKIGIEKEFETIESNSYVPVLKGNVPKLAIRMGLLPSKYYKLINACDGRRRIVEIANYLNKDIRDVKSDILYLSKLKLLKIAIYCN